MRLNLHIDENDNTVTLCGSWIERDVIYDGEKINTLKHVLGLLKIFMAVSSDKSAIEDVCLTFEKDAVDNFNFVCRGVQR